MSNNPNSSAKSATSIPQDNPKRALTVSRADDHNAQHIGLVGDTYTILLTGKDTARADRAALHPSAPASRSARAGNFKCVLQRFSGFDNVICSATHCHRPSRRIQVSMNRS